MANSHNTKAFTWEHGPMALLSVPSTETSGSSPRIQAATELTLIHNSLIRALNSIYIQSPHIPLDEYINFTSYALATYLGLRAHRSSRLFSTLRDAQTFETALTAWGNWLQSIAARSNNFNSLICRSMMDDFRAALHTHFGIVVECVLDENNIGVPALLKQHKLAVFGNMSKTEVLPVFVGNHDEMYGGERHEFPVARMWVVREVYARKKAAWWKFSTVGKDGRGREVSPAVEDRVTVPGPKYS
jgi:hypothetical protein